MHGRLLQPFAELVNSSLTSHFSGDRTTPLSTAPVNNNNMIYCILQPKFLTVTTVLKTSVKTVENTITVLK